MKILHLLTLIFVLNKLFGQHLILADPINLFKIEYESYFDSTITPNLTIRPIITNNDIYNWKIKVRSELYFNNNAPNYENMGNRFIGKGIGSFNSINISYLGKYFSFAIEPFYLNSQNKPIEIIGRNGIFSKLNDVPYNRSSYEPFGFRESMIFVHYNNIGFGFSNSNLWWGPGIHNSLVMTNNTTGFPHIMIGTLNEKRYKNIGYNLRYYFSKLDKTLGNPYFTALVGSLRFYTTPLITIGLSRNYVSGGLPTDRPFTSRDAALLIFEQLLIDTKIREYPDDWEAHDPWDQTMAAFMMLDFLESKLRLYLEVGTNDHRQNLSDLRAQPDHALAYIIGLRKYSLFNNDNLIGGFEYANLILGRFWSHRATPNWYDRYSYDYSSYDGLRWAAHSGSDSDDFYIYFGYNGNKWSIIPALNYERHGVIFTRPAEVKMELRIDFSYIWKDYRINIFFEREWLEHAGFVPNKWRIGNVIWFGIERDITKDISNKLRLVKN